MAGSVEGGQDVLKFLDVGLVNYYTLHSLVMQDGHVYYVTVKGNELVILWLRMCMYCRFCISSCCNLIVEIEKKTSLYEVLVAHLSRAQKTKTRARMRTCNARKHTRTHTYIHAQQQSLFLSL